MKFSFSEIVEINPRESIPRGKVAKKVAMQNLYENVRDIQGFVEESFKSGSKFRQGDTLFARITPCLENGKIAQVNILEDNEVAFGSTEFLVFRAREGISIPDYVYHLSKWDYVRQLAIKSMTGTSGRQRVQNSIFDEIMIKLPSTDEQQKIVNILNTFDRKIELNNKIIANLEDQAQAIFKSWFIDFEPFQDGDFVESELGLIPEGWKASTTGK
jgi:type I restriction enzyme S subunit